MWPALLPSYSRRSPAGRNPPQTCELWAQNYPREMVSHDYLAAIYPTFGRYDQGVEEAKKAIGLAPDFAIGYALLAMKYQFLDLLEEATNTLQQASGRKLEIPDFLVQRYDILLKSDKEEMQQEAALGQGKSGAEDWISDHQAFCVGVFWPLARGPEVSHDAAELAQHAAQRDRAALDGTGLALWEGFFGNAPEASRNAMAARELSK